MDVERNSLPTDQTHFVQMLSTVISYNRNELILGGRIGLWTQQALGFVRRRFDKTHRKRLLFMGIFGQNGHICFSFLPNVRGLELDKDLWQEVCKLRAH